MAVVSTLSNHFKQQFLLCNIKFSTDVFKVILMNQNFGFDPDNHNTLADITSLQLPTGNGYTQNNKVLSGINITQDNNIDKGVVAFDSITWEASGGNIGPFKSAIIYDDTTSDDTIIACIDFGQSFTIPDSMGFQIKDLKIQVG